MREPWNLTLAEIGKLTPYQLHNVYFRRRDRHGRLLRSDDGGESYESVFRKTWKDRGETDAQVEARWHAYLAAPQQ